MKSENDINKKLDAILYHREIQENIKFEIFIWKLTDGNFESSNGFPIVFYNKNLSILINTSENMVSCDFNFYEIGGDHFPSEYVTTLKHVYINLSKIFNRLFYKFNSCDIYCDYQENFRCLVYSDSVTDIKMNTEAKFSTLGLENDDQVVLNELLTLKDLGKAEFKKYI